MNTKYMLAGLLVVGNALNAGTYKSLNGYKIEVPTTFNQSVIDTFRPKGLNNTDVCGVNLIVQNLAPDMTLDSYIELSKQQYEQMHASILEVSDTKMGNLPAKRLIVIAGILKNLHVCVVKDHKAYLLTYVASLDKFDAHLAEAEKMITSWEFAE